MYNNIIYIYIYTASLVHCRCKRSSQGGIATLLLCCQSGVATLLLPMVRENKKEFKAAGGDNKAECRLGRVKPTMRRQNAMGSKVLEPNRNRGTEL